MLSQHEILEREFAEFIGFPPECVVACSSWTAALHLAMESLKIPKRAVVVVPDYTMVACARACTMADLKPVFVDCKQDLTLDPKRVSNLWRKDSKYVRDTPSDIFAIMAVHVYGRRCDMDSLAEIAERKKLYLIEDQAESHGAPVHPRTDAACWSFYKNKIVAGEEGGVVTFRQKGFADRARGLRCLGFTAAHDYTHTPRGYNYRLADCLAERIRDSLGMYEDRVAFRWKSWRMIDAALGLGSVPPDQPWVYVLRTDCPAHAVAEMRAEGVPARYGFAPMTMQEEYRVRLSVAKKRSPVAYQARDEVIYLPLPISTDQLEVAARALRWGKMWPI